MDSDTQMEDKIIYYHYHMNSSKYKIEENGVFLPGLFAS